MWVDMFPRDMTAPGPALDISPRKPKKYVLCSVRLRQTFYMSPRILISKEVLPPCRTLGCMMNFESQESEISTLTKHFFESLVADPVNKFIIQFS